MKKKPITRVGIVLDRSGSMLTIRDEMIAGCNDQLKVLRQSEEEGNEVYVTLISFATFVDKPIFLNAPVSSIPNLTPERYQPEGATAMFDGVGDMLDSLCENKDLNDENVSFLVLVISDGEENASQRFGPSAIAQRVKALQATGRWTFVYLGANQDLSEVKENMNLYTGNTAAFNSTAEGTVRASYVTSQNLASYMNSRAQGVSSTDNFYKIS